MADVEIEQHEVDRVLRGVNGGDDCSPRRGVVNEQVDLIAGGRPERRSGRDPAGHPGPGVQRLVDHPSVDLWSGYLTAGAVGEFHLEIGLVQRCVVHEEGAGEVRQD
jgi:hypothetical protein